MGGATSTARGQRQQQQQEGKKLQEKVREVEAELGRLLEGLAQQVINERGAESSSEPGVEMQLEEAESEMQVL